MRINWKKLVKEIPASVKVGPRIHYEVLWTNQFENPDLMGEMRPDNRQIVIKSGLSPKETVTTFFHEWLHAVSDENEAALTEQQVSQLEKRFVDFQTFFNLFK